MVCFRICHNLKSEDASNDAMLGKFKGYQLQKLWFCNRLYMQGG